MRDRYAGMIKEQQQQQEEYNGNQNETQSIRGKTMLDTMIAERMIDSKLTRVHEIDRQINTFVIAGKHWLLSRYYLIIASY